MRNIINKLLPLAFLFLVSVTSWVLLVLILLFGMQQLVHGLMAVTNIAVEAF